MQQCTSGSDVIVSDMADCGHQSVHSRSPQRGFTGGAGRRQSHGGKQNLFDALLRIWRRAHIADHTSRARRRCATSVHDLLHLLGGQGSGTVSVGTLSNYKCLILGVLITWVGRPLQTSNLGSTEKHGTVPQDSREGVHVPFAGRSRSRRAREHGRHRLSPGLPAL
jgi:hypothetical protein